MKNQTVFRVGQKVYVSDPRMPQYGRRVTREQFFGWTQFGYVFDLQVSLGTCTTELNTKMEIESVSRRFLQLDKLVKQS